MNDAYLDKNWDKILEALPVESLKELLDLPESEMSPIRVYEILEKSGVDFEAILDMEETDGNNA